MDNNWKIHTLRVTFNLSYLLITFIPSLFGPKTGGPKFRVDPSSLFHLINYIFVKAGFLLTLLCLLMVGGFNGLVGARKSFGAFKDSMRFACLVCFWLIWRVIFVAINDATGVCVIKSKERIFGNAKECIDAGGYWDGFDISGHCFLIALAVSLFLEDFIKSVRWLCDHFERRARNSPFLLELGTISNEAGQEESDDRESEEKHPPTNFQITGLCVSLGCMLLVWIAWTSLLFHTSLYFHTLWEKILGLLIGFSYSWFIIVISHCNKSRINS